MDKKIKSLAKQILSDHSKIILMDIGASGEGHKPFQALLEFSTLIEFEPDSRDIDYTKINDHKLIIPSVITDEEGVDEVTLFLTNSPHCSSTLQPHIECTMEWAYGESFKVESSVQVPATTLSKCLKENNINQLNWLKIDSQGTDGRILKSISQELMNSLVVIEAEPGFCDHYKEADDFGVIHNFLLSQGFFLSDMNLQKQERIRAENLNTLYEQFNPLLKKFAKKAVFCSPTAPELTYLKSIKGARESFSSEKEWSLLWLFSILNKQLSYAYDVSIEIEEIFGKTEIDYKAVSKKMIIKNALKSAPKSLFTYICQKLKIA